LHLKKSKSPFSNLTQVPGDQKSTRNPKFGDLRAVFQVLIRLQPNRISREKLLKIKQIGDHASMAAEIAHGSCTDVPPVPVPPKRSPAHCLWAVRIARIYEVFPLLRPICGGQMRIQ
jgi:hypothetical protein